MQQRIEAVGDDADLKVLEQFSDERKPLQLKGLQFREMFKWLSASLARVSKQKAGAGQQVGLPPTDGWEVTHVGHVNLHQDDCEFAWECVMIRKGSTQVILYYSGGSIRAEFDWPHLYSPL